MHSPASVTVTVHSWWAPAGIPTSQQELQMDMTLLFLFSQPSVFASMPLQLKQSLKSSGYLAQPLNRGSCQSLTYSIVEVWAFNSALNSCDNFPKIKVPSVTTMLLSHICLILHSQAEEDRTMCRFITQGDICMTFNCYKVWFSSKTNSYVDKGIENTQWDEVDPPKGHDCSQ